MIIQSPATQSRKPVYFDHLRDGPFEMSSEAVSLAVTGALTVVFFSTLD